MQLPAKIEYALKAVMELSLRYKDNASIQVNTISESQGIPKKFLIQLLLRLKNANIVGSSRGAAGGYYLTRLPSQVSLADVVRAIDDSFIGALKKPRTVKSDSDKVIHGIWEDINKETAGRLSGITFDKLISKINNGQFTYYI